MSVLVAEWWRCSGEGELREILNEWDPIGVFGMGLDRPPDDEYDSYLSPVFTALHEGGAAAEVRRALESALGRMGLGPAGEREDLFAERIACWWRASFPNEG
jgi:hypothetical protein